MTHKTAEKMLLGNRWGKTLVFVFPLLDYREQYVALLEAQHNGEEQNQSLARARPAEQQQIPDRSTDQFQRQLLVFRKFKNIHKSKSFFYHRGRRAH